MPNIKAYGQVSVRDYTDIGRISLYLQSTQPTSVVYDPNQNIYLPDWSEPNNELEITPVVTYNGTTLNLAQCINNATLVVTFKKRIGSESISALDPTSETVTDGVLRVTQNMSSTESRLLTYICNVTYTDPQIAIPISTEATLTFTLVDNATDIKQISIIGESLFLYDTDGNNVGANYIELRAQKTSNLSSIVWQYQDSSGVYQNFPKTTGKNDSITGTTIKVYRDEQSIWLNNDRIAIIKCSGTGSNSGIYDIHQINKIKDGARGNSLISIILTNENHSVPCDADDNVIDGGFSGAETKVVIYKGGEDVTADGWTITPQKSSGLAGTYNSTTHVFTPSGLTTPTGYVDFTCSKTEDGTTTSVIKRYTITKARNGADATIYSLNTDTPIVKLNKTGNTLSPSQITLSSYATVGNGTPTLSAAAFKIEESMDGATFPATPKYTTTGSLEQTVTYSITAPNASTGAYVKLIRCTLYRNLEMTKVLDTQTIPIVKDGSDGSDGENGISMYLGNYQDAIPCTSAGLTSQAVNVQIPYFALQGIKKVAATATITTTLPTGVSSSITDATASTDGLITISFPANNNLGLTTGLSAQINIRISVTLNGQTQVTDHKYTFTKNLQGTDATILQVYSKDGGNISNSQGSTTWEIRLISGSGTVTPGAVKWYKLENAQYREITGQTGTSLTVTADMVDDQAFFQVRAWYPGNGTTQGEPYYDGYFVVDDQVDPYWAETRATVSEFKNGKGYGAIWTQVYQNGVEVDKIKSTTFSNEPPIGAQKDDYYYHLDPVNKTCILKQYNGSEWVNVNQNDVDDFSYQYTARDNQGKIVTVNNSQIFATTRCFYIDPSMINGSMQFICEIS